MSFVEKHGLWSDDGAKAGAELARRFRSGEFETIRFAFPDQHGVLRGKTMIAPDAAGALTGGCSVTSTLLAKDTAHRTVFPVFTPGAGFGMPGLEGGADFLLVPDPATFRALPWAPGTGWLLCDAYFPDGSPVPIATRTILRRTLDRLGERGWSFVSGLEVEFHLFRVLDPKLGLSDAGQPGTPPELGLLGQGYQYLTESRYDALEPVLDLLRRDLLALGLPLRSMEVEYGPSQCELTFRPATGLAAADDAVLFRSAVRQVARRHGYLASFMCRPRIPQAMSSGWHLHQSVRDAAGRNLFIAPDGEAGPVSALGLNWLAGILAHARAASVFTTPTINGYRRLRAYSLAPDRAVWGRDNRGVMMRVLGGPGDPATRLENRIGEPAANPYLYVASQVAAGLDGVDRALDPGPSADTPYEADAPRLPRSLAEAVDALAADPFHRAAFGDVFVDYLVRIKEAEIARFEAEVSEWEQREYLDMF